MLLGLQINAWSIGTGRWLSTRANYSVISRLPRRDVATRSIIVASSATLRTNCPAWCFQHGGVQRFASSSSSQTQEALDGTITAVVSNHTSSSTTTNTNEEEKERIYQELKWVATELRRHDDLYYNNNNNNINPQTSNEPPQQEPSITTIAISDDEYDALAEREAALCRAHPDLWQRWRTESGWGRLATLYEGRVGMAVAAAAVTEEEDAPTVATTTTTNRKKQTHLHPMLSLDNAHTTEQLLAWLERVKKKLVVAPPATNGPSSEQLTIVTEPKLDGISLSLRYERPSSEMENGASGRSAMPHTLQWASTRGDGRKGTDVTQAVRQMKSIPEQLRFAAKQDDFTVLLPDIVEVRGEVVMPKSVFEQLRNEYQQQLKDDAADHTQDGNETSSSSSMLGISFSNARNAASGILQRHKEPAPSKKNATGDGGADDDKTENTSATSYTESEELRSQLRFYAYDIVTSSENATPDPRGWNGLETRRLLELKGFSVPEPTATTKLTIPVNGTEPWTEKDIPNMMAYYEALREFRLDERKVSNKAAGRSTKSKQQNDYEWGDFDMDGCVHKIAESSVRILLGSSTRFPRWAIAHKFPPTAVVTELLDMEVQVGRTGALTPVAVLKPVDIAGVTVQRATLHNFAHMRQVLGDVDRVLKGSSVLVRRAGKSLIMICCFFLERCVGFISLNSCCFIVPNDRRCHTASGFAGIQSTQS